MTPLPALRFLSGVAIATLLAASFAATAAEAASRGNARAGNSYEFHFEGNPSTGYRWLYNEAKSDNPGIVRVDDLGYGKPASRKLGAPAPYNFRVTCLKGGNAELWFAYRGPTGKIGEEHTHWARCD